MKQWEEIIKDKMEEFDDTLPESVFAEFRARRDGTVHVPKRSRMIWATLLHRPIFLLSRQWTFPKRLLSLRLLPLRLLSLRLLPRKQSLMMLNLQKNRLRNWQSQQNKQQNRKNNRLNERWDQWWNNLNLQQSGPKSRSHLLAGPSPEAAFLQLSYHLL